MAIDLARLKSLHAAATQGEWEYRPGEFDDWGFIRGPVNPHGEQWIVAQSRPGEYLTDEQYDQHRANTTDPCKPNGLAICSLHNAAPELIARAELLEWLIREMRMIPEVEHGDAGVVVLYDEYIAPWMDEIEKRYRALEATDGK